MNETKKEQKGIKVIVDDEILKMFDWLEVNKGMSRTGAVRMGLKVLCATDPIITSDIPVIDKEEDEAKKAKLKKVEEEIKRCIETNDLCHIHQKGVNDCGCAENGQLREKLMIIY